MDINIKLQPPCKTLLFLCIIVCFLRNGNSTLSTIDSVIKPSAVLHQNTTNVSTGGGISRTGGNLAEEKNKLEHMKTGVSMQMMDENHYQVHKIGKKVSKRSSGFTALRGKKTLADEFFDSDDDIRNGDTTMDTQHGTSKEFQEDELRDTFNRQYPQLTPDSEIKRATGFLPMRGRKDSSDSLGSDGSDMNKRPSSGFLPMRGRKDSSDETLPELAKKLSSFLPMRGRKLSEEEEEDFSDVFPMTDDIKRAMSFLPMRGKKEEDKRASAFVPMRGRKSTYDVTADDESMVKRPSSFVPMRGRKSSSEDQLADDLQLDKKAVGFLPMRGRKSELDDPAYFYRSSYPYVFPGLGSSFLSMSPYQDKRRAFHALRGKKGPYRINWDSSKRAFHATRGKRMNNPSLLDEDESFDQTPAGLRTDVDAVDANILRVKRSNQRSRTLYHHRSRTAVGIKRPITFFATRGKRVGSDNTYKAEYPLTG